MFPGFLCSRFLRSFAAAASLVLVGVVALFPTNLALPFERLVTLNGSMGAQHSFFNDERVRELLLQHHIRVNVIRQGSIGAVTGDLDSLEFVFTSGDPAAQFLLERLRAAGEYFSVHRSFVSPIVLATFREYAETLHSAGVATPQTTPDFDRPYFYKLDMAGFLALVRDQKSWNDLNGPDHGIENPNRVLAQTTNVCESNSGSTYVGMVSYVFHEYRVPTTDAETTDFASRIKPLIDPSLAVGDPDIYFTEGRRSTPIIVLYEHQYLAHQMKYREQSGQLDGDRVLLYSDPAAPAQAAFVALNETAAKLGVLLSTDPDLCQRAVELGQQVLDPTSEDHSEELPALLAQRGVPVPSLPDAGVALPKLPLLKKMIEVVDGHCIIGTRDG
ncbi:MAG: hypothetical protein ACRDRG_03920 [Pseudonocardiaceae bacterium]